MQRNDEKLNPGSSSTKPAGKNPVRDAPGDATTGKRLEVDKMNGEYDRAAGNRKSDRVKGSRAERASLYRLFRGGWLIGKEGRRNQGLTWIICHQERILRSTIDQPSCLMMIGWP
ncbi:hypothetical protein Salat_2709600 [Sesamum alatum]|uniref:Uncharacterized protein n=1 Tax=Sesamum alatum TaxID=300844 RepID=A0AAE1XR05_9LAMI|nr:hypothetical protein Salat_2709600 [Sesamum alatum]